MISVDAIDVQSPTAPVSEASMWRYARFGLLSTTANVFRSARAGRRRSQRRRDCLQSRNKWRMRKDRAGPGSNCRVPVSEQIDGFERLLGSSQENRSYGRPMRGQAFVGIPSS